MSVRCTRRQWRALPRSNAPTVDMQGHHVTFDPQAPGIRTKGTVNPGHLLGVSCPSVTQCTAVGWRYEVTFSPQSGSHTRALVSPAQEEGKMSAVACPSVSQCTAVSRIARDQVTFEPRSPRGVTPIAIDSLDESYGYDAVACPSVIQCTAVGQDGEEVTFDPRTYPHARVRAALAHILTVSGKAARIGQLLARGFYNAVFDAPRVGRFTESWSVPAGRARSSVLIASSDDTFSAPSRYAVGPILTRRGRQLLESRSRVTVLGTASFRAPGQKAMTRTRTFTLKRMTRSRECFRFSHAEQPAIASATFRKCGLCSIVVLADERIRPAGVAPRAGAGRALGHERDRGRDQHRTIPRVRAIAADGQSVVPLTRSRQRPDCLSSAG